MSMHRLVLTTPCTRPENLGEIHRSIFTPPGAAHFEIEWHVVFDAAALPEIPVAVLERFAADPQVFLSFNRAALDDTWPAHAHINTVLQGLYGQEFWHYVVDDDTVLHPDLLARLHQTIQAQPDKRGIIFSQWVGGADFSGLEVREARPEHVAVSKIDQGQCVLHSSVIAHRLYPTDYLGDGRFIVDVYQTSPNAFAFVPEVLCYYNKLRRPAAGAALPRILVVGKTDAPLRSTARAHWESDQLDVHCLDSDAAAQVEIARFDPDAIVSFQATATTHPALFDLPYDLRRRWFDVADTTSDDLGERAYNCAMNYILNRNQDADYAQPLVSIFTPLYQTGVRLQRTYRSVRAQTYPNWEWVLVDDSPHLGPTWKIAEEIANREPRVKLHRFRTPSGGLVGEAKYRTATLCRGSYLLELDHDDELTPWAVELLVKAFQQFPEAGFAYSDWALVDEQLRPLNYGDEFAFGYGAYYEKTYRDVALKVVRQPAMNPKTARHIVGVPNHFRAWRREVYHAIGGHNRRLSIADDYELVVRTFLATRMVHVPRFCYLQYLSRAAGTNTQMGALGDIQRRVRSISWFYNDRIRRRFEQLGLRDWAAEECPHNPLLAPSRFGSDEQSASLVMSLPVSTPGS